MLALGSLQQDLLASQNPAARIHCPPGYSPILPVEEGLTSIGGSSCCHLPAIKLRATHAR